PVFAVVEQAVFCGEGIVSGVQLGLLGGNVGIREIFELVGDQFVDEAPQLRHPLDSLLRVAAQIHWRHDRIFAVVDLTIYHRIGEIFVVRVGGQNVRSTFVQLRFRPLGGNVPALNLCGGLLELSGQVGPLDGINCHI